MKINFNQPITDFDGDILERPVVDKRGKVKEDCFEDMTLGSICKEALTSPGKDEDKITQQIKLDRYALAKAIHDSMETKAPVEVSAEDISLIKGLVSDRYIITIVGAVCNLLESCKAEEVN